MKSRVIALSAITSAFIALFLTIGAYFEVIDLFCIIIASAIVILPSYYKSYLGCFLTYLVGGIIAFIFSGFNILSLVFPCYFVFAGIYPIIALICLEKKVKMTLLYVFGLIWCVATFYGAYFYYTVVMDGIIDNVPDFIINSIYYIIGVFGIAFYFLYHKFILVLKIVSDKYLKRIIKK